MTRQVGEPSNPEPKPESIPAPEPVLEPTPNPPPMSPILYPPPPDIDHRAIPPDAYFKPDGVTVVWPWQANGFWAP